MSAALTNEMEIKQIKKYPTLGNRVLGVDFSSDYFSSFFLGQYRDEFLQ